MKSISNTLRKKEDTSKSDYQYICMYDHDLKVIDCCTSYATMNGLDHSELIGKSLDEVYTGLSNSRIAQFSEVLATGTPNIAEIQFTSRTNKRVYAEEKIYRLNGHLMVVGKDITRDKKEQEAKEEQEYALSLIAKHSEQFFLLVDVYGKILFMDKTYPAYTMEQVIGSYIYDYNDEKSNEIMRECIATILVTKEANTYEVYADVGDGTYMIFEGVITPIIENGEIIQLSIVTNGITERKRHEEELKAINKQYVNLLKLTNSGSFTQDKELRYTHILNVKESINNKLLVGRTDRELLNPFDKEAQNVEAIKLEVLRTGKVIRRDIKLNINKKVLHYDLLVQPLFDERGETIGVTGTSINITERIKRKEALEESERRLKEGEEIAHVGYYDLDLATRDLNWSEETYRIIGVSPKDYNPNLDSYLDFLHPEDRYIINDALEEIIKTGKDSEVIYRLQKENKEIQYIRNIAKGRFTKAGEIVNVFGTVQDITQQTRLELELKKQKAFIQKIMDSSPSLIFILDLEKRENIFINNVSEKLLGYSKEEVRRNHNLFLNELSNITLAAIEDNVLNKSATTFLSFIHPAERQLFIEFIHMFVEDRADRIFDLNFRHQHKKGHWIWLHHRLIAFNRNEEGKVTQLLGIVSDITSLKEAEKKSKIAMIEGQEKERQRIAKDLHDAINPLLSAAKLNVESLQYNIDIDSEKHINLSNIVSLLSQSMASIKDISFDLMPSILKDFGLVFTLRDYCNKITEGGILIVNLDIYGIETRLGKEKEVMLFRIAQELINNVIKHANASQVDVQLIAHQKTFILMVEDNGNGIEDKTNTSSTGYGLKNVESRAKALNGSMAIDSIKNRGTIITIEIPRK